MCRTCAVLVQVNHSCGHQLLLVKGGAKFCLFHSHGEADFHMATIAYASRPTDYTCEDCALREEATARGIHGEARRAFLRKRLANSREAQSKSDARWYLDAAAQSQQGVDDAKIAELQKRVESQIKYYLGPKGRGKRAESTADKAILLKTVLQVPDVLDRQALVAAFGTSVVWDQEKKERRFIPGGQMAALKAIARKANLLRSLETGFKSRPSDV
ncbi:uncharacterized protein F4812DRAFT_464807 [Daldinia caldariorum]|uniref:uncharacterized protein n=1 Tax=Daldinia caldariorum TaxID=326644 RepID=UPI002008B8C9|nr:uncharacterized protein F4812DRAFT_464807 [Daldinia caldariorum]KAI1472777.1 hypothetical protein F4812DRAFT_464807 [Daldinia caldariorum]